VRHKIMDAIGDFYLLGRRLQAKVTARMTGHSDNIAMLRRVQEMMASEAAGAKANGG
jgi:UDP-3-O-acyl-N-acetylglucosamine deacetylase